MKNFAICYSKYERTPKGRLVSKIHHESFTGTWDDLEDYLMRICGTLLAFDYVDATI